MMISTVKLPVMKADTTVKSAIEKIRQSGTSAFVALDTAGPVVIDDQMLRNTQIVAGDDAPVSTATRAALLPNTSSVFSFSRPQATLVPKQPGFAVLNWNDSIATVKTDPGRAEAMAQPSILFGK
jgi:hypothetical protein